MAQDFSPVPYGMAVAGNAAVTFRRAVLAGVLILSGMATRPLVAQGPVPLADRARGAERVVVGQVASITPEWQENEHGDRLIVSVVRVRIEETLKGDAATTMDVEVEGGTIGDLTLHVSDQASFRRGERAAFFLRRNPRGRFSPHLRGQGLLKLDGSGRVAGTSVTLPQIRREVGAARGR
jgi:hypothetical protein